MKFVYWLRTIKETLVDNKTSIKVCQKGQTYDLELAMLTIYITQVFSFISKIAIANSFFLLNLTCFVI